MTICLPSYFNIIGTRIKIEQYINLRTLKAPHCINTLIFMSNSSEDSVFAGKCYGQADGQDETNKLLQLL